jgi:hypothetical protein
MIPPRFIAVFLIVLYSTKLKRILEIVSLHVAEGIPVMWTYVHGIITSLDL